jgi:hypothetical protein
MAILPSSIPCSRWMHWERSRRCRFQLEYLQYTTQVSTFRTGEADWSLLRSVRAFVDIVVVVVVVAVVTVAVAVARAIAVAVAQHHIAGGSPLHTAAEHLPEVEWAAACHRGEYGRRAGYSWCSSGQCPRTNGICTGGTRHRCRRCQYRYPRLCPIASLVSVTRGRKVERKRKTKE